MARGYYARTIFTPTMFSRRRKGDDTVGNPCRAQIAQFELFEISLLWKLDKQFPVKRFEATVSQSAVPSPPLKVSPIGKIVQMIGDLQAKVIKEGEEAQKVYSEFAEWCEDSTYIYIYTCISLSLSIYIYIYTDICIHLEYISHIHAIFITYTHA